MIVPTLSRLPGYPAFLAAIFAVFGWGNFRAVLLIQVLFDLGTCLLDRRSRTPPVPSIAPQKPRSCSLHFVHSSPTILPRLSPKLWKSSSPRWRWISPYRGLASFSTESDPARSTSRLDRLRPLHRRQHPVAARRRNSPRRRWRLFVLIFSEDTSSGNSAGITPPASHPARRNCSARQRPRSPGPLDAAQPAHPASLRTARPALRQ